MGTSLSIRVREVSTDLCGISVERQRDGLCVRAFLPGSQVDIKPVRNLDHFVNQEIRVRILKLDQKKGNIVLSRKVVVEEELESRRKDMMESLPARELP